MWQRRWQSVEGVVAENSLFASACFQERILDPKLCSWSPPPCSCLLTGPQSWSCDVCTGRAPQLSPYWLWCLDRGTPEGDTKEGVNTEQKGNYHIKRVKTIIRKKCFTGRYVTIIAEHTRRRNCSLLQRLHISLQLCALTMGVQLKFFHKTNTAGDWTLCWWWGWGGRSEWCCPPGVHMTLLYK